jgi:hypothetical protein
MKRIYFLMILFSCNSIFSQTLTQVVNPNNHRYSGFPIEYNGKMYILQNQNFSMLLNLFEFDGTSYTPISLPPNIDPNISNGFREKPIVYNNKLYLKCMNNNQIGELYEFDGLNLNLIPNPPNTGGYNNPNSGYSGSHIVYNGKLYLSFAGGNNNMNGIYEYDGSNLVHVPNTSCIIGGTNFYEFNNKIYMLRYNNCSGNNILYEFDGVNFTEIPNPLNHNNLNRGYSGYPIAYGGNLYLQYRNNDNVLQLYKYDGTTLNLIPNPPNHNNANRGYVGNPIVFNGKLYLRYFANNQVNQLYEFDGTNLVAVANPPNNNPTLGYSGYSPIVFNGKIYLGYYEYINHEVIRLYEFDGVNFTLIPSPPNHDGQYKGYYGEHSFTYNGNAFFQYVDNNDNVQIFKFSNTTSPQAPAAPTNLTATTNKRSNGSIELNWQDNANNEDGFYVEFSQDTTSSSWTLLATLSVDEETYIHTGLNDGEQFFYRVSAFNAVGSSAFSNVAETTVSVNSFHDFFENNISIYPNPVKNHLFINANQNNGNLLAEIFDLTGKRIKEVNIINNLEKIDVSEFDNGMYYLKINANEGVKVLKFIKN